MLQAGAASRDITPRLGGDFFGYVRPDLRARGVALRLHAHALVLHDGTRKVCVLTVDLGAPLITACVLERVRHLGFDAGNLIVTATHTHAGPSRPGVWVAERAAAAVMAADAARRPAAAAWAQVRVDDANRTRSLEAHLANHGLDLYPGTGTSDLDPAGEDHPRDVHLRLLRVEETSGQPLAAWAHFSAHPTTMGPANTAFSADYPGAATRHFRRRFGSDAPVAIVTNGTEGDLIPRYDDINQHACADRMGRQVADAMRRAWDLAEPGSEELTVAGRSQRIVYAGQEVGPGRRVGDKPWFGLPFLGGAQNGPSFFFGLGLEGRRRPRWRAGPVHGRKIVALPGPHPRHAHVTVLRIGDRLLLSVPGEPTVETGRRMRAAALEAIGPSCGDALIVGLAQSYLGYFTTPEEYDQQHYEGGHTVYGKHTSALVEQAHAALAGALDSTLDRAIDGPADGSAAGAVGAHGSDAAAAVPAAEESGRWRKPRGVAPPGRTATSRLRVLEQPPPVVERYGTVQLSWRGARRGADRPLDGPFLVVERQRDDERGWEAVDDDLGIGLVWEQRGRRASARYEVPGDLPCGRYRIVLRGARVTVASRSFEVVPSRGLRVLGVEHHHRRLLVHAQNPPPDPALALRSRAVTPSGGRVRGRVDGRPFEARWDALHRAWTAEVAERPTTVEIPAGGLEDGDGNRSGDGFALPVGHRHARTWPPSHGPGGGRAPGLFGGRLLGPPMPRPGVSRRRCGGSGVGW
jgi:neutral ceramidase